MLHAFLHYNCKKKTYVDKFTNGFIICVPALSNPLPLHDSFCNEFLHFIIVKLNKSFQVQATSPNIKTTEPVCYSDFSNKILQGQRKAWKGCGTLGVLYTSQLGEDNQSNSVYSDRRAIGRALKQVVKPDGLMKIQMLNFPYMPC